VPPATTDQSRDLDWKRPHPFTALYEVIRIGRSIVFLLIITRSNVFNFEGITESVVIIFPLAGALARWLSTRYAIDDDAVHYRRGVLWRHRQIMPRSRIQNVSTTAGLAARLTSLVEVQISDASKDGDITIRFIRAEEANRLTALLRGQTPSRALGGEPHVDDATAAEHGPFPPTTAPPVGPPVDSLQVAPLVELPLGNLIRFEVTSSKTVKAVASAVLLGLIAIGVVFSDRFDLVIADDIQETTGDLSLILVILVASSVGLPLIAGAFLPIERVLHLGGFRLTAEPDRFRIQSGLITEAKIAARRERIQLLDVKRDFFHRRLGVERVGFATADVDSLSQWDINLLHPAGPHDSWRSLGVEAIGPLQLDTDDLNQVSPKTRRRTLIRMALAAAVEAIIGFVFVPLITAVAVAAYAAWAWYFARTRFATLGWARSADQLLVRTGVFDHRIVLIQIDKIQNLRVSQTFFQRRLKLASLMVSTAGESSSSHVEIIDLDLEVAQRLHDQVAERAGQTPINEIL